MPFPKTPHKPVTGNLRLIIKDPAVEVTVGEDLPVGGSGPDLAVTAEFKVPKGFSISEDPVDVVNAQHTRVSKQLAELRKKRETCPACKRATSGQMVDAVDLTLRCVVSMLTAKSLPVKIKFKQETDGTLVTYFESGTRTLGLIVTTSAVEIGYYLENGLSAEKKHRITTYDPAPHAIWLAG